MFWVHCSSGSRISGKGVHMHYGVGVRFADFISFFLNIHFERPLVVKPC